MKKLHLDFNTFNPELLTGKIGLGMMAATILTNTACAASDGTLDLSETVKPIVGLINSLMGPVLAIVLAVGAIYCVFLGLAYAKAEEPQDREKAKQHLKSAVIGFVLIFVLIFLLNVGMKLMVQWVNTNAGTSLTVSGQSDMSGKLPSTITGQSSTTTN